MNFTIDRYITTTFCLSDNCLSLLPSLSLGLCHSVSVFVSLFVQSLPVHLCLCVFVCSSLSLDLCWFVSVFKSLSVRLYLLVFVGPSLSLDLCLSVSILWSLSVRLCLYMSVLLFHTKFPFLCPISVSNLLTEKP